MPAVFLPETQACIPMRNSALQQQKRSVHCRSQRRKMAAARDFLLSCPPPSLDGRATNSSRPSRGSVTSPDASACSACELNRYRNSGCCTCSESMREVCGWGGKGGGVGRLAGRGGGMFTRVDGINSQPGQGAGAGLNGGGGGRGQETGDG